MCHDEPSSDPRVYIDVGGKLFVTYRGTLLRLPNTKLARLSPEDSNYDHNTKSYFFDRNPRVFDQILDLYRIGQLHFPHCLCGPFLKQELEFWGLDEGFISDCCWKAYSDYDLENDKMKTVEKALHRHSLRLNAENARREAAEKGEEPSQEIRRGGWARIKEKVWFFLEDPTSSIAAKVRFGPSTLTE